MIEIEKVTLPTVEKHLAEIARLLAIIAAQMEKMAKATVNYREI